jgi:hypothetical protein
LGIQGVAERVGKSIGTHNQLFING